MTQFALYAILIIVATAALVLPSLWFGKRRRAEGGKCEAAVRTGQTPDAPAPVQRRGAGGGHRR